MSCRLLYHSKRSVADEIMEYVKRIATMGWDKGHKYFYSKKNRSICNIGKVC